MHQEILFHEKNHIGYVLLNRPHALNALSLHMIHALFTQLTAWKSEENIAAIIIEGAGERAFCAGGDVRYVYQNRDKLLSGEENYFDAEYQLNELIFNYPKPYIALLNGITMGGGVGVSIWGSHRIATESLVFAMPETSIGLFPDIGASYFLTRLPHWMGWYLGLTGNAINAYEAYTLGIVHTILSNEQLATFKEKLDPYSIVLPAPTALNTGSDLLEHTADVERCFSKSSIEEIIAALEKGDPWCQATAATLKTRSPLSLKVTLQYLNISQDKSFHEIIQLNRTLAYHFIRHPEFFEGIRAAVIDKDKNPTWTYTLSDIDDAIITNFFLTKAPTDP